MNAAFWLDEINFMTKWIALPTHQLDIKVLWYYPLFIFFSRNWYHHEQLSGWLPVGETWRIDSTCFRAHRCNLITLSHIEWNVFHLPIKLFLLSKSLYFTCKVIDRFNGTLNIEINMGAERLSRSSCLL